MNDSLIFRTQDNKEVLSFSDFKFEFDDVLKRVIFKLSVDYGIFKAETITEAEEYDFIDLKKGLTDIYNNKLKTHVFNPIEEVLNIKFELLDTGQIIIEFELKNDMNTGRLFVKFKSDITFLPSLIKDIECALHKA